MPIDSYWGHNIRTWYGRMVRFYKGFQVRVAENDNAQDFWTIKPGLNSEGDEALLIKLSAIDGTDYDDLDESSADRVIDFSQRRQVVVGETTLAAGSHTYNISDVAQYAGLPRFSGAGWTTGFTTPACPKRGLRGRFRRRCMGWSSAATISTR